MRKGHAKAFLGAALVSCTFAVAISPAIFAAEITYTPKPKVDVSFDLIPSVAINIVGGDLIIPHLVPGHAEQSNPITISVATNSPNGYTLKANAGSETDTSANLKHANVTTIEPPDTEHVVDSQFTPLTTSVVGLEGIGINQWGFSIDGGENFAGLPGFDEDGILLQQTSSMAPDESISFLIGANADAGMTAGVYGNVVNFITIVNPTPETPEP